MLAEARAVGERTKALESAKKTASVLKTSVLKKQEKQTPRRELFCQENLQEIEDSLLSPEEGSTAEGVREASTIEDFRASAADAKADEALNEFLEEDAAEQQMEE